jgi:hypothetical protein
VLKPKVSSAIIALLTTPENSKHWLQNAYQYDVFILFLDEFHQILISEIASEVKFQSFFLIMEILTKFFDFLALSKLFWLSLNIETFGKLHTAVDGLSKIANSSSESQCTI